MKEDAMRLLDARSGRVTENSLFFIGFKAACEQPGCPICNFTLRGGRRYLSAFVHEGVLDVGMRLEISRARGFCGAHAWQVHQLEWAEWRDGLGVGIVYEDLCGAAIAMLAASRKPLSPLMRRVAAWTGLPLEMQSVHRAHESLYPEGLCPACEHQRFDERYALKELAVQLSQPETRSSYDEWLSHSGGMCREHLRRFRAGRSARAHSSPRGGTGLRPTPEVLHRVTEVTQRNAEDLAAKLATLPSGPSDAEERIAPIEQATALLFGGVMLHRARYQVTPEPLAAARRALLEPDAALMACTICRRVRGAEVTWVRILLERVAASPSEVALKQEASGLCPFHGALLLSVAIVEQSPIAAVAAFYRGMLIRCGEENTGPTGNGRAPELDGRIVSEGCAACRIAGRAAGQTLQSLAGFDPPTARVGSCCLPHFRTLLDLAQDDAARQVWMAQQEERLNALLVELKEYLRKHDYRYRDEPWGEELSSPVRAVAAFSGWPECVPGLVDVAGDAVCGGERVLAGGGRSAATRW
jgi:hypothetical protein